MKTISRHRLAGIVPAVITAAIIFLVPLTACEPTTENTTTPAQTTQETEEPATVAGFLAAAQQRYAEGLICSDRELEPHFFGITEEEFNSLSVISDTILQFDGTPYFYASIADSAGFVRGTVALEEYSFVFEDPQPGVTATGGGIATLITVYRNGQPLGEDTYATQTLNLIFNSVTVRGVSIGEVKVIAIHYLVDCGNYDGRWLMLAPVPPPVEE